jgi:hypothetical protein
MGESYYWRVRFMDDEGVASEWSQTFVLHVEQELYDGSNLVCIEDGGDASSGNGQDDDKSDDTLSCSVALTNGGTILFYNGSNIQIDAIQLRSDHDIPSVQPPDSTSLSILSFRIRSQEPRDDIAVEVVLYPVTSQKTNWYTYNVVHGWQNSDREITFDGNKMTLPMALTDGHTTDTDNTVNGSIVVTIGIDSIVWDDEPPPSNNADTSNDNGINCFVNILQDSW